MLVESAVWNSSGGTINKDKARNGAGPDPALLELGSWFQIHFAVVGKLLCCKQPFLGWLGSWKVQLCGDCPSCHCLLLWLGTGSSLFHSAPSPGSQLERNPTVWVSPNSPLVRFWANPCPTADGPALPPPGSGEPIGKQSGCDDGTCALARGERAVKGTFCFYPSFKKTPLWTPDFIGRAPFQLLNIHFSLGYRQSRARNLPNVSLQKQTCW